MAGAGITDGSSINPPIRYTASVVGMNMEKAIATLARKQGNATDAQRSVQLLSNDGESMEEWTFRAPHKCTLNFYQYAEKPQLSIKIALDALRVVGKIEKSEGIPRAASNEMENCRIKNSKAEVRKFYYGKAH